MVPDTESHQLVMEAIRRAIAATTAGAAGWQVCVRNPDGGGDLISFKLATFKEVEMLAAEIRQRGYELTMLHPVHTQCDFVLEPRKAEEG